MTFNIQHIWHVCELSGVTASEDNGDERLELAFQGGFSLVLTFKTKVARDEWQFALQTGNDVPMLYED